MIKKDWNPKEVALKLKADHLRRNLKKRKIRWYRSCLDNYSHEIISLRKEGCTLEELRDYLLKKRRDPLLRKINCSTISRWLKKEYFPSQNDKKE